MAPPLKHKLPAWAQVSSSSTVTSQPPDPTKPVSLTEEELYLRSRAYAALVHDLEDVLHRTISTRLDDLAHQLQRFFLKCSDDAEANGDDEGTSISSSSQSHFPFCVAPPRRYNPRMLPVALLPAPGHLLDRRQLATCLTQQITKLQSRAAVAHVQGSNDDVHCGRLLRDIWQQCTQQEPDERYVVSKKRKRWSQTSQLLAWASRTTSFDRIIVLLEGTPNRDFIQLLADLRLYQGLPINLILISHSPVDYDGPSCLVETMALPSSQELLDPVWRHLLLNSNLLMPPTIVAAIHSSFLNYHDSFVKTAALWKQWIASHFATRRGSLLTGLSHRFLRHEERRLAWFCLDPEGRAILLGETEDAEPSTKTILLDKLQTAHLHQTNVHCILKALDALLDKIQLVEVVESLQRPTLMQAMAARIVERGRKWPQQALFARLATMRDALRLKCDDTSVVHTFYQRIGFQPRTPSVLQSAMDSTNEVILLLDRGWGDETIQADLWVAVEEWILGLLRMLSYPDTPTTTPADLFPQHRASVAEALESQDIDESSDRVRAAPSLLFHLLRDIIAISRGEWFQKFQEYWAIVDPEEASFLFSLGIYQLQHVGLIREKRINKQVVYEKAALVWSSGRE